MYPLSLPTNTLPATTVGCDAEVSPVGNPNAHFSFRFGTCAAVRPAPRAGWKRVLALSIPQPFQVGAFVMLVIVGLLGHLFGMFFASPAAELPIGRPDMNSARRRIWGSPSPSACIFILPVDIDSKI